MEASERASAWVLPGGVRLVLALLVVVLGVVLSAGPAGAHNTLVTTDPAEGAVVDAVGQVRFRFAKDVPEGTATVDLVEAEGRRPLEVERPPGRPGELLATLPPGLAGPLTLRWRLVGPDGHVLTERLRFTVAAASVGPGAATPSTSAPPPAATGGAQASEGSESSEGAQAGSALRFGVRLGGFVAASALGGLVAMALVVSPRLVGEREPRHWGAWAAGGVAGTALLGTWVLASDIGESWPGASRADLWTALGLSAGRASVVRLALALLVVWLLLRRRQQMSARGVWLVTAGVTVAVLATWSYAGHARTGRWGWLGVPFDVVHHAAAAAWLGGLLLMVSRVLPRAAPDEAVAAVRRFSSLAAVAVPALVGTGVFQGLRLVGGPAGLFTTGHGRLLLAKLVVLGGMLAVANINRRRVQRGFSNPPTAGPRLRHALRRAMVTEAVLGLAVLGFTAALVVTTPATGTSDAAAAPAASASPARAR